jgi:hypothetical protein
VNVEVDLDVEVYADVDMDKDMGKGMDKDMEHGTWIEHGHGKVSSASLLLTHVPFRSRSIMHGCTCIYVYM